MSKYLIKGGNTLSGTIRVAGNKNAVLPIMAATLLVDGDVTIENVPQIQDVSVTKQILRSLGAHVVDHDDHTVTINTKDVSRFEIPVELSAKLRASVLFLGPLFARFGKAVLPHPGGDIIGRRSIQTHIDALGLLGAGIVDGEDVYRVSRATHVSGHVQIFLDEPSVTGTENVIMASVLGKHDVTIKNAAQEPHVADLVHMLISAGADISGGGTNTIHVKGQTSLHECSHRVSIDYLEAGTFAMMGAITRSEIIIEDVPYDDLTLPLLFLERMGVTYKREGTSLVTIPHPLVSSGNKIQAGPHPLFPTDLMSPFIVLATQAQGETLFHDPLYESRMFFVDKLIRMGARITICDPHRVIVNGPTTLSAKRLASPDIRAGIALVLAALVAEGESEIDMAEIIERGYENLDVRLRALGADIRKVE